MKRSVGDKNTVNVIGQSRKRKTDVTSNFLKSQENFNSKRSEQQHNFSRCGHRSYCLFICHKSIKRGGGIRCVIVEPRLSSWILHPRSVALVGVQANKKTTTTMTIIHCIITFVGSCYNKDFHFLTNVINPCSRNSYCICGKSRVTFVVGSGH